MCTQYYDESYGCDLYDETTYECTCESYDTTNLVCNDAICYSGEYDEDDECMDDDVCPYWYDDTGVCVCPSGGEFVDYDSCDLSGCATYYTEESGCVVCPMDYYDTTDPSICLSTQLCESGIWYYSEELEYYTCFCAGFWGTDDTTGE